jgi:hypothetical protein
MRKKYSIKDMQRMAQKRGGKCLSQQYINNYTPLLWECKLGHRWETKPYYVIIMGTWCPKCAGIMTHTIQEMRIFAEGKKGKCLSHEYINHNTSLLWECEKGHRWEARPNNVVLKGNWCPKCANRLLISIVEMKELARSRGGECLSDEIIKYRQKLKWQCEKGHQWNAISSSIRQGHWCPTCSYEKSRERQRHFDNIDQIIKEKGGEWVSGEYINAKSNLRIKCEKGHIWDVLEGNLKRGGWCPECARRKRLTIQKMNDLARERGGLCLSKEYKNIRSKLTWQCNEGHTWDSTPSNILNNCWCPICADFKQRNGLNIQEMMRIAHMRGGICLSKEYVNTRSKLLWECEKGHRWESSLSNINLNHWCPECRKLARLKN